MSQGAPHRRRRPRPQRRAPAAPVPSVAPPPSRSVPFAVAVATVARVEILRLARDRRAIVLGLLLPVLLYPLLFAGNRWLERLSAETLAAREVTAALELSAAPPRLAERLRTLLGQEIPIVLREVEPGAADELAASVELGTRAAFEHEREEVRRLWGPGGHALLLCLPHPDLPGRLTFRLHYDGSSDISNEARARALRALRALEAEERHARVDEVLGRDPAAVLGHETVDVASSADQGGATLGRFLPLFAVLVMLSGGSFAALATFAGEREVGTLETLLVQPASSDAFAWGKFAAVFLTGVTTLVLNAASMLACVGLGLGSFGGLGQDGPLVLDLSRLLSTGVVFLPACVLVCAVLCLVCGRARSFREGQHYLLPLILIAMVPTALATRPEVELDLLLACVPLAGPALAFRDALAGHLAWATGTAAFASSVLWSCLALSRLGSLLDAERVLQSRDSEHESGLRRLQSRHAVRVGLCGVLVVYVAGGWLQSLDLVRGLLVTLWVLLPILTLIAALPIARRAGEGLARSMWLRLPAPQHALAAVLLAPALAAAVVRGVEWQQRLLPLPSSMTAEGLFPEIGELSLGALLFAFALSPGICEELFFRGALLSGLRRDLPAWRSVTWQALLFGAVHSSIYRFAPTAVVGAVLAGITLRARSVVPAMLLHASYNALALLAAREELPAVLAATWLPWLALPGLALFLLRPREEVEPSSG